MKTLLSFTRWGGRLAGLSLVIAAGVGGLAPAAAAEDFGAWSPAVNIQAIPGTHSDFNTSSLDGCPTLARDGLTFYMASNRSGGKGGLDIWVSTRERPDAPWGEPVNVEPLNTPDDEFCPSPARDGHLFFFVSTRPGGCGGSDIYVSRRRADEHGWDEPVDIGCDVNSNGNEASPFLIYERDAGPVLYFSSNRAGGFAEDAPGAATGDDDIYFSELHGGIVGPAELAPDVNTPSNDSRPNLRRDGLEIFFDSNRNGNADIFSATRASTAGPWSTPAPLGEAVNTPAAETRASLSWDGTVLVFGSTRNGGEGSTDIYVTTRRKLVGSD